MKNRSCKWALGDRTLEVPGRPAPQACLPFPLPTPTLLICNQPSKPHLGQYGNQEDFLEIYFVNCYYYYYAL